MQSLHIPVNQTCLAGSLWLYPGYSWRTTSGIFYSDTSFHNIWVWITPGLKSQKLLIPSRIFLILCVLGNMATCLVIMKNEYMRTTTNIYLFNLAVTDLATLLFAMPSELYLMWRQYPWTFGEVRSSENIRINSLLLHSGCL